MIEFLAEELGGVDGFVNNAGTGEGKPLLVHEHQPRVGSSAYDAAKHSLGGFVKTAAVIAFLASPAAGYVSGASWALDGGMLQMSPQAGSHLTSDDWRKGWSRGFSP